MVARVLKRRASNCLPWSVVICWGQAKRATQIKTKALATASVVMSDRGSASGQRVYLSMAVRQYRNLEEMEWPDQVDMHERRADGRSELPRGVFTCHVYLGQLAGCTCTCPCTAVFTHSRPHKPLGYQLDGIGPGVAKAVEGVKDLASERRGYKWLRLWSGRVAVDIDIGPGNVHSFQSKRGTIFRTSWSSAS